MSTTQIHDALPEEDLLGIEPDLLQQVNAGWLQRLSLFTGRTLSDTALIQEQAYRAGRLNLLGQAVTSGIVQGLDISADLTVPDPTLLVAPGYGISATGQDVTLRRSLKTTLSGLAVLDGQTGAFVSSFPDYAKTLKTTWAGILALQAVIANVPGSVVDSGATNLIVSGNLDASCDQDPDEYAFGDSQLVDATRLVLLTWPTSPASLALPSLGPTNSYRNRLAYTVFNAELALGPDDRLPWDLLAVPLAIAAFNASSALAFIDRSSVARAGGFRRNRYVLPGSDSQTLAVVQPALASARISQFSEQLGPVLTSTSVPGLIASQFASIPPCGILPAFTMDFANKLALWPPTSWQVTAVPVFTQELEGILETAALAAPLVTSATEIVEVFVPLPDAVYDPTILMTEIIDPVFEQEVAAARLARNVELQHLTLIELETNALAAVLGQSAIVLNAGLTADEIAGRDGAFVFTVDPDEAFGTTSAPNANLPSGTTATPINATYTSTDLTAIYAVVASSYTVTSNGTAIPLVNDTDFKDLTANGLQHFIDMISARIDQANDLLDLAFLTTQTDIYRYRQNVLGTADATRLAVSPILANIASGATATATAQNIHDYLVANKTTAPIGKPPFEPETIPVTTATGAPNVANVATAKASISSRALSIGSIPLSPIRTFNPLPITTITKQPTGTPVETATGIKNLGSSVGIQTGIQTGILASSASRLINAATFNPISVGTVSNPATPVDITQQSPIVGEQLDLRTITIAERLAPSASQEALFYSVGNRWAMLLLLADLELTIDDLPILVDGGAVFTVASLKPTPDPKLKEAIFQPSPVTLTLSTDGMPNPDEGGTFATGIHVAEQHTALLRAIEGRIQQYQDFLTFCRTALSNVQSDMQFAQSTLTRLQNDLNQSRQNLAFVQSLENDEEARIASVNATRTSVLKTYVQYVAYARPRTLINTARTPSRQLLPANVTSPVPGCLKQTTAIPPELREMVSLLREAPLSWFPSFQSQLGKLERPTLLQSLASDMQVRAAVQLQVPARTSSATTAAGVYSSSIAGVYTALQQTVRSYQTQRSAFDATQLVSQSWSTQIATLQTVVAPADLLASQYVHTEVSNAASRLLQQISSVATCLYTRIGNTLPGDRLEWAEFLQNNGVSVNLRSLAVLPGWNSQAYVDRQQMQLLVDWLFQQVDASDQTALTLMSDLVAVAILLASNAPVDSILAGAVALRTKPILGSPIRLTLPSDRVAHGMTVQLYSAGDLAARAVVSDLDSTGVTATVTDVYKPGVSLEASDIAHFTALDRDAVVYKAFSK